MHFFLKEPLKAPMTLHFCIFLFVLELTHLSWHKMSKFPGFIGFWGFPKDSKVIPIYVRNSHELGKFPESSHTVGEVLHSPCPIPVPVMQRHPEIVAKTSIISGLGPIRLGLELAT